MSHARTTATASNSEALNYRPLDWALLRSPLLPIEHYERIGRNAYDAERELVRDERVAAALAIGSPALYEALTGQRVGGDGVREKSSLLRYLLRMSSRTTPYGMFSGVALIEWGPATTLRLSGRTRTRSRPDMAWTTAIVSEAAADPDVRRHLSLSANRLANIQGNRVLLPETGSHHHGPRPSIRATAPVLKAMELTRQPRAYERLLNDLQAATDAPAATVAALIDDLCRTSVLMTSLQPDLTAPDPVQAASRVLRAIPAGKRAAAALEDICAELAHWDNAPGPSVKAYSIIARHALERHPSTEPPIQVDMKWETEGRVSARIADTAARAADLLLSLTPAPAGPAHLQAYKQAFVARYGHHRKVPLVELLDPATGLGSPAAFPGTAAVDPQRAARRNLRLSKLATTALRTGHTTVELSDDDLDQLRSWDPQPDRLPLSVELSVFVVAESSAAIDEDRFQLAIGPNLGAPAAGRSLGRFASLLGPAAVEALRAIGAAESDLNPGSTIAEVVYFPGNPRSANVAIRPSTRQFEVVTAVHATEVGGAVQIPIDELLVDLSDGQFRVTWARDGRRILPASGHMLNSRAAPPAVAFLSDLWEDGHAQLLPFDWGQSAGLPFLPRVVRHNIILRPAQWLLQEGAISTGSAPSSDIGGLDGFAAWASEWKVPIRIYLSAGDNRLLLNLDEPDHLAELAREYRKLSKGQRLLLQEAIPGPDHAWLPGHQGHYASELVIPMTRRNRYTVPPRESEVASTATDDILLPEVTDEERNRFPGSEWMYAKLAVSRSTEDEVIRGPLREFCSLAILTGTAREWFFLRYSDPGDHLRLRFHGDPASLTDLLFPRLCAWADGLRRQGLCNTWSLDTYEREIERYGGPAGTSIAERIFCADSEATAGILQLTAGHDAVETAMLSIDDLLASLGFNLESRLGWYRKYVSDRRASGGEYRLRGTILRNTIMTYLRGGDPYLENLRTILSQRHRRVVPEAVKAATLQRAGALRIDHDEFARDLVHLHCNRLLGRATNENVILGLLLRTYEGLQRSGTLPARGSARR